MADAPSGLALSHPCGRRLHSSLGRVLGCSGEEDSRAPGCGWVQAGTRSAASSKPATGGRGWPTAAACPPSAPRASHTQHRPRTATLQAVLTTALQSLLLISSAKRSALPGLVLECLSTVLTTRSVLRGGVPGAGWAWA